VTGWIEPVTLAGEHVVLEPVERRHEAGLARAAADGALWQLWYTSVPPPEHVGEYVRAALAAGVPYLGICLGGQMLVRALDHQVYSAGVREIGFNALHPTLEAAEDHLMSVFSDGDVVFHWHEDTFDLPEDATLLATGDLVRTQAFRYGEAAWGTQFHLEVDRAEIDLWLKTAGDEGVRAWGSTREELEAQTDRFIDGHEDRARELFRRFWGVVRGGG